jgi:hypothetical protein
MAMKSVKVMNMIVDSSKVSNPVLKSILDKLSKSSNSRHYRQYLRNSYNEDRDNPEPEHDKYVKYDKHERYSQYAKEIREDYTEHGDYRRWSGGDDGPGYEEHREYTKDASYKRNCFIATAALGTSSSPKIGAIRFVRDHYEANSKLIGIAAEEYRTVAPPIADAVSQSSLLKKIAIGLVVDPLSDFSEAYLTDNGREKLTKYAKSMPFFAGFVGALTASKVISKIKNKPSMRI